MSIQSWIAEQQFNSFLNIVQPNARAAGFHFRIINWHRDIRHPRPVILNGYKEQSIFLPRGTRIGRAPSSAPHRNGQHSQQAAEGTASEPDNLTAQPEPPSENPTVPRTGFAGFEYSD